jgi:hypothetical protein
MEDKNVNPYIGVATACGCASAGIAALAFFLLHEISDSGMWALAAMVAAPSIMGIGIAYFMSREKR